jgi:uncharacterized protein (DUF58 family)
MVLTRTGRTLMAAALVTCASGVLFGNWPVLGAGALLLLVVSMGRLARMPHAERRVDATHVARGARVVLDITVEAPRGLGVVEVRQRLPDEFELVEGNNLHLVTLSPFRARRHEFRLVVRIPKRGEWTLAPLDLKLQHPLGLVESPVEQAGEAATILAEPRALPARIPRDLRTRAKRPFPDGDLARMGVATNEFRELREYVPGDPPRRINWKATARALSSGASDVPLVNETEWEGKKSVYILVDGHARLSVGTNLEDAREHAADAAISLIELYLRRGYQVSVALAHSGQVETLRPGAGEAQVRRARAMLARLRPEPGPTLVEVLQRDAAILHRQRPLIVLVTRLAGDDPDLEAALRRIGAHGRQQGRNLVPGLVLDLQPESRVEGDGGALAEASIRVDDIKMQRAARVAGLRVVPWRAGREPLTAVLVRGRVQ